jgi:hypothetical protein
MLNFQTNPILADALPAMSHNDLQIHCTIDLSVFKVIDGNRNINLGHVDRLVKSIKDNGFLKTPIIVNKFYEVVDGQHRLEAAKKANSQIYYIKVDDYDLNTAITLNANSSNWSLIDYVRSYCDLGYKDYIKLNELYESNKDFSLAICAELSTNNTISNLASNRSKSPENVDLLKRGLFEYNNHNNAEYIFEGMRKIKGFINESNTINYCRAIKKCIEVKEFQLDQFVKKVTNYSDQYRKASSLNIIISNIEYIYNYNVKNVKNRIYLSVK